MYYVQKLGNNHSKVDSAIMGAVPGRGIPYPDIKLIGINNG